ncbi:hypothetical protein G7Y89_g12856 [Cudoniella acicularis]|uniref:Zn(2)-C6 fungal-type domain-containing protein n=1 Tax=Cudoniella acicularis TaxID=354080 RepID=A0A8H4R8C1_9HELO|nr:hypothetical protein G7Y89_g12856 [Cudoniella acicularis]
MLQNHEATEGRKTSNTACTECRRRKQKCDQKQPCKHCARRYPPPKCIYPNENQFTPPRAECPEPNQIKILIISRTNTTVEYMNLENYRSLLIHHRYDLSTGSTDDNTFTAESNTFPVVPVDTFNSAYQWLLRSMVTNLNTLKSSDTTSSDFGSTETDAFDSQLLEQCSQYLESGGTPNTFSMEVVEPLHYLPIDSTIHTGHLFQVFVKIIIKYVVSMDGNPTPNYYNDHWIRLQLQSPLLCTMAMGLAACYQAEFQKMPANRSPVALAIKHKSIQMLNEMLRDKEQSTCDEALAAVVYFVTSEWYWGTNESLKAHFRGLTDMVRLRGGVDAVINFFVRQMIILCDYNIACSSECEPAFYRRIPEPSIYDISLSSPLLSSKETFLAQADTLFINKETAVILDNMQFLFKSVIKLSDAKYTTQDEIKLIATATWIRDGILAIPLQTDIKLPSAANFIHQSCRIAALIYCKSLIEHIPLSQACELKDFQALWKCMWRVTLTEWKRTPGIFLWVILSANQAAQNKPYGRLLKSMFKGSSFYISLVDWPVINVKCRKVKQAITA